MRMTAVSIVFLAVLVVAGIALLGLTNTVPFCTPNYTLNASTIIMEPEQKQALRSRMDRMERTAVKRVPTDVEVADLGPTVAYFTAEEDRFWVVQEGTIAGNLYYGPFTGQPRTCTLYPETYNIGRASRVLGN